MPVVHYLFGAFNLAFNLKMPLMRSAMDLHLLPFLLGSRSRNDLQHFSGDLLLSASAAVRLVDGRAFCLFFFFFFFFFLLSIAQRIRSKPPPSHMKVLSFVRDVRTFEMTPKRILLCTLMITEFIEFLTYELKRLGNNNVT